MTDIQKRQLFMFFALLAVVFFLCEPAFASSGGGSGGGGLPWEGPLDKIKNSLTGPVAMGISIIGLFVAGGTLIFGGELGEFARRMIMVVLVISLLVSGNAVIQNVFGSSGAVISQPHIVQYSHE